MDILRKTGMRSTSTIFGIVIIIFTVNALAQLSPGDLSRPHAFLEGVENCSKCHGFEQKLAPDKCLSCHKILAEQIVAGKGLHANADHKDCGVCHVEHQGKDYDLVYWKNGKIKFDHSQTGFILEGKHATVECRACHKDINIAAKQKFVDEKIDLDRTYLGLGRECLGCHLDEHRAQLSSNCLSCHAMDGWKPAAAFDHSKAKFALTGKHVLVKCQDCHPSIPDKTSSDGKVYVKFTGLQYEKCLDCHKDAHENRFGQNCEGCHNTSGWSSVNQMKFDHSKTKYPLEGAHAMIACNKCHQEGKSFSGLKFQICTDCHSDYHQGQFAARESKGACEECHTVAGYSPAKFTMDEHQKTNYPLAGAHQAIPCDACHTKEKPSGKPETIQFKFESTRCMICHKDPHKGAVDSFTAKGGCEYCHLVDAWEVSSYDHSQSKFALDGRHKTVSCRSCHLKGTGEAAILQFSGLPQNCQGCHDDIHRGQFATITAVALNNKGETDCVRCHTPSDWKETKFDHNRDAAFKLDGAHINVPCNECHKPIMVDSKLFIKYKPLDSACSACHGGNVVSSGAGKS